MRDLRCSSRVVFVLEQLRREPAVDGRRWGPLSLRVNLWGTGSTRAALRQIEAASCAVITQGAYQSRICPLSTASYLRCSLVCGELLFAVAGAGATGVRQSPYFRRTLPRGAVSSSAAKPSFFDKYSLKNDGPVLLLESLAISRPSASLPRCAWRECVNGVGAIMGGP